MYPIARSPEYLTPKLLPDSACIYPSQARGEFMFASERRTTCRRKLHLPLRFHRQNALAEDENGATSVNVSTSGVYFISIFRYQSPEFVHEEIHAAPGGPDHARLLPYAPGSRSLRGEPGES
jgi:hypothetical protein